MVRVIFWSFEGGYRLVPPFFYWYTNGTQCEDCVPLCYSSNILFVVVAVWLCGLKAVVYCWCMLRGKKRSFSVLDRIRAQKKENEARERSGMLREVGVQDCGGVVLKEDGTIRKVLSSGDVKEVFVALKEGGAEANDVDKEMLVNMLRGKDSMEVALLNPSIPSVRRAQDFLVDTLVEQGICKYVAVVTKRSNADAYQIAEVRNVRGDITDPLFETGDVLVAQRVVVDLTEDDWREKLSSREFFEIHEKDRRDREDIAARQEESRRVAHLAWEQRKRGIEQEEREKQKERGEHSSGDEDGVQS